MTISRQYLLSSIIGRQRDHQGRSRTNEVWFESRGPATACPTEGDCQCTSSTTPCDPNLRSVQRFVSPIAESPCLFQAGSLVQATLKICGPKSEKKKRFPIENSKGLKDAQLTRSAASEQVRDQGDPFRLRELRGEHGFD